MKRILSIVFTITCIASYSQTQSIIDGDTVHLRDSVDGKILLSYIKRGKQHNEAHWITYDRRPSVDPWITNVKNKEEKFTDANFIRYWNEMDVRILGAITTYDDCGCVKTREFGAPDMYLIHFKIYPGDWERLKAIYPEIQQYTRKVKIR